MTQVSFSIDDETKTDAEALFSRLGLNLPTAINIFIHQSLHYRGLPFEVKEDPFYSPENLAHLRKVSADYDAGRNFSKHELVEIGGADE